MHTKRKKDPEENRQKDGEMIFNIILIQYGEETGKEDVTYVCYMLL